MTADRIEELERERDAFYMDYRMKCDEEFKALCVERDVLQADNARLRDALEDIYMTNPCDTHSQQAAFDKAHSALFATPEQSLAAYRNKVIEECASVCDKRSMRKNDGNWTDFEWDSICGTNELAADEIRAMKEQP